MNYIIDYLKDNTHSLRDLPKDTHQNIVQLLKLLANKWEEYTKSLDNKNQNNDNNYVESKENAEEINMDSVNDDHANMEIYEEYQANITFDNPVVFSYMKQDYLSYDKFLKQVQWSPDGTKILSNCEDNLLRLYLLNYDDINNTTPNELPLYLSFNAGETVYDYKWYPGSNYSIPGSSVFLTTSKDNPIHLWDAEYGHLRASYVPVDDGDELQSALSISFNLDGTKIYAGFNSYIRRFDLDRPGYDFEEYPLMILNDPVKRNKLRYVGPCDELPGFISCITFSPDHSGLFARGTYDKLVGIYKEDNVELVMKLSGFEGGITDLKFSKDGSQLFCGCRKDPWIYCWDLRNTRNVLYKMERKSNTSQKMFFDIDPYNQYLVTGSQDNSIYIYDIINNPGTLIKKIDGLNDVINCVQFHPYLPILATSSGKRRYIIDDDFDDSDSSSDNDESSYENEIKLWRLY